MTFSVFAPSTCFICKEEAQEGHDFDTESRLVQCARCGRYVITMEAQEALHSGEWKAPQLARLSSAVRLATETNRQVILTLALIPVLIGSVTPPADPMEAADPVLLHILERSGFFGAGIKFHLQTLYPLFTLQNSAELSHVLSYMATQQWVQITPGATSPGVTLLPAGYARIREIRSTRIASRRAFVAMSFDASLRPAYDDGIRPAIVDTGFVPVRIDDEPHNDRIDDRILAELRRSAFVVADFSLIRSGVFFEAGFGLGLSLPVIWTCSSSGFAELPAHFDTRQYNHIQWGNPAELRVKLRTKILATIPGAKSKD